MFSHEELLMRMVAKTDTLLLDAAEALSNDLKVGHDMLLFLALNQPSWSQVKHDISYISY